MTAVPYVRFVTHTPLLVTNIVSVFRGQYYYLYYPHHPEHCSTDTSVNVDITPHTSYSKITSYPRQETRAKNYFVHQGNTWLFLIMSNVSKLITNWLIFPHYEITHYRKAPCDQIFTPLPLTPYGHISAGKIYKFPMLTKLLNKFSWKMCKFKSRQKE